MIQVEELVNKLARRYPQLERVSETICRCVDAYHGRPFAIRYFDLGDDLEAAAGQLHDYQDRLLGKSYYNTESKADLRWNYYLYIVTSNLWNDASLKTKAAIETDREYARKFVVTEAELDRLLNDRIFGADKSQALPPDAVEIWAATLEKNGLGFIVDQSLQVPAVTRHIAEGERKPVLRPPAPPELDSAERAASNEFLAGIAIQGFRKYPSRKAFQFGAVNLIFGVNGVGKTSLLEAIEYLFCGKTRRSGSLLPATAISGILSESQLKLETRRSTSQPRLRARHLAWYGKSELRTLTLDDSFAKFNFLDTDAAVRLSVEKSRDRLVDDLADLLLGAEASKVLDRFGRVLRQLGDDKKAVEANIAVCDVRFSEAAAQIESLRNAPRVSDSIFSDLLSALRLLGWILPVDKAQIVRLSESIHLALVNVAILRDYRDSVATNPVEIQGSIDSLREAETTIQGLREREAARKRAENTAKVRREKITKRLEAIEALAPLVAAGIDELHHRSHALESRVSNQSSTLAAAETAVAILHVDPAIRTRQLSEAVRHWSELVRTASVEVEAATKTLSAFEGTQQLMISLQQRLRASAHEMMEHTGDSTHCPVCRAVYAREELEKKLEQLTEAAAKSESDRLRRDLHQAQVSHQQCTSELSALQDIAQYVKDMDLTVGSAIDKIAVDRAELAALFSELQAVRQKLQAQAQLGYSFQRLVELASAADIPASNRSSTTIDVLQASFIDEREKIAAELRSLQDGGHDSSKRLAEIAVANRLQESTAEDLERQILERRRSLEAVSRASAALRDELKIPDGLTLSELEAQLRATDDIAVRLRTAIAKESQETEAIEREIKRRDDAQAEINGLRIRLGRLDRATAVLENLLAQQSERALTDLVKRENATRISSTFAKIHAPNEFDLVMNGELEIVRRGSGKVELDEMSSGQRSAYALSLFLAMNERLNNGPQVLLFDDPVAHVDDINTLSLLDHLRDVALTNKRQIFFATADSKIAALFARKFRFLGDRFKQIELLRD